MRTYFIHDGKDQKGPYTIDQLSNLGLQSNHSVWAEGMADWTIAANVPELKHLFSVGPPVFDIDPAFQSPTSTTQNNKKFFVYITIGVVAVVIASWAVFNSQDGAQAGNSETITTDTFTNQNGATNTIDSTITRTNSSDVASQAIDTTTSFAPDVATSVPILTDMAAAADYTAQYYTEDLRAELITKEQSRPLDYLSLNCELTENLVGENVFKGSVINSATAAPFKDIEVHVVYYSGTGTELATDHFTLYKYIAAGTTANFKVKRPGTSSNVKKYRIGIVDALPAE